MGPKVGTVVRWTLWVLFLLGALSWNFWAHFQKNDIIFQHEKTMANLAKQQEKLIEQRELYRKLWLQCEIHMENREAPTEWQAPLSH